MEQKSFKTIINFLSDANGCGFHRTVIPFNYLMSKGGYDVPNMFSFLFDINLLARADYIRFQRQVTVAQTKIIKEYKSMITQVKSKAKIVYELDDLVHGITPNNTLAYQFYTKTRRNNLIEIMKLSDTVTFSTNFLKDFYKAEYGIDNSIVIPNLLAKYMWQDKGKRDKYNKGKNGRMRILYSGSSSHVAKGGDLEFLIPLIKKTATEFEWVFMGCKPGGISDLVEFHPWADFYGYAAAMDAIDADIAIAPITDNVFNYAKSDLKLLEYTAVGLPGIYSNISGKGPYDLVPNAITAVNNADAWYTVLKDMELNPEKRIAALEATQVELNKRWLEDNINVYTNTYK